MSLLHLELKNTINKYKSRDKIIMLVEVISFHRIVFWKRKSFLVECRKEEIIWHWGNLKPTLKSDYRCRISWIYFALFCVARHLNSIVFFLLCETKTVAKTSVQQPKRASLKIPRNIFRIFLLYRMVVSSTEIYGNSISHKRGQGPSTMRIPPIHITFRDWNRKILLLISVGNNITGFYNSGLRLGLI